MSATGLRATARGIPRRVVDGLAALLATLATMCLLAAPPSAWAQAPQRERHLVYGIQAFNGLGYVSAFAPPTADTLYLMADADNAISPRETEIYWWPLSSRYEPDWNALNQPVEGRLEIWRAFERLASLEPTTFVVQFPDGTNGPGSLYRGQEAEARYADFEARRRAYRDALWEYYQQDAGYRSRLQDAVARAAHGETSEMPEPPREPEPFRFFSTSPSRGYVLNLPPGRYRVRVVGANGRVVPESERNLLVFAPRRQGLSYAIYPRSRWTRPVGADDPAAAIYTAGGGVFYAQPFESLEVNDRFFSRMQDPQNDSVVEDTWRWVRVRPYEGGTLEVATAGSAPVRVDQRRYQVKQSPGSGLGYEIVEIADPGGPTPDLYAFRIDVEPGRAYALRLLDRAGSAVAAGSREIRPTVAPDSPALVAIPAVPILAAAALALRRRR